jgi:hypothetical protein
MYMFLLVFLGLPGDRNETTPGAFAHQMLGLFLTRHEA